MIDTLLQQDDLARYSGYERRLDIIKWLKQNHIPFHLGKGGEPCTTLAALNHSLIGTARQGEAVTLE